MTSLNVDVVIADSESFRPALPIESGHTFRWFSATPRG